MNKIELLGRLTRDPEMRYVGSDASLAVCHYGLAVQRRRAREGEQNVDFFNITAFAKTGEFAHKYFKKGQMIALVGHVQTGTWEDEKHIKHNTFDIVVDEQFFAGSNRNETAHDELGHEEEMPF